MPEDYRETRVGDQMFQYLKQESSTFSEFMTLSSNQAFWDYLTKHPELKQLLGESFSQKAHDIEEYNKGVIFFRASCQPSFNSARALFFAILLLRKKRGTCACYIQQDYPAT